MELYFLQLQDTGAGCWRKVKTFSGQEAVLPLHP
jgi:hypothetical protein